MEINKENLQKLAHLARLKVSDSEEKQLLERLNKVVAWADKLKEMDVEGIEPLRVMSFEKNIVRRDIADNMLKTEDAVKVAPKVHNNHFIVPKVIE